MKLYNKGKKYSEKWFDSRCEEFPKGKTGIINNLNVNFFKSSEIPWDSNPNKDTLLYYLFRYLEVENKFDRAGSKGSENPYKLGSKEFFRFYDMQREEIESQEFSSKLHEYSEFSNRRVLGKYQE